MTILVADDDAAVRYVVATALRGAGHTVVEAATGDEAAELGTAEVDLLITDRVMPPRGGLELAHELQTRHPALPVLYMSGYAPRTEFNSDSTACQLSKPFTLADLLSHVNWLLPSQNRH
jgi:CheY-like chemotaxis protein